MELVKVAWKLLKEVWKNMLSKGLLLLYFVVMASVTGYLTCTLWMAAPNQPAKVQTVGTVKDTGTANAATGASNAAGANDATKQAGTQGTANGGTTSNTGVLAAPATTADCKPGDPKITRLDPDEVAIGENYATVAIYGCNFKTDQKVRFNGQERQSNFVSDNEWIASLSATDFAAPGNAAVSVDGKDSAGKVVTSNAANLRIKSSSDVKAIWRYRGRVREITLELRLILLIVFTGTLAASISGLKSFVDYLGECKFEPRWYSFYVAEPFIGAGLAYVFYLVLRGGLMAGSNVDMKAVNPFGFVAVAALVGLFSDAAYRKLNDVADTFFKAKDTRSGKLDDLTICPDVPNAGTNGQPYGSFTFQATGGTPPYTWSTTDALLGLTLSQQGVLAGTPNAAGAPTIKITVTDSANKTATRSFTLTINP